MAFYAATPVSAQVKFGVKAGLNLSKASFDKDVLSADNRTGFVVGPMAEVTLPVVGLGIDAALLYDNKSVKAKAEVAGEEVSKSETLQYIDIPINLKYSVGLGSVAGVFVTTGPQFSYNIGGKKIFNQSYSLKSSEFSWNVGAGVKLLSHLQVAYNYNIALGTTADVNKDGAFGTITGAVGDALGGKMKNNTHQVTVAYLF